MKKIYRLLLRVVGFIERKISHIKLNTLLKSLGENTHGHWSVEVKYGENICIGSNSTIGPYTTLGGMAKIDIGDYVRISKGVVLETAGLNLNEKPPYKHHAKSITIENGVWIATNAIILGGVTIGENSIIGAGAVVTKDVAPNSILVGQPSRILQKKINR